MDDIDDFSYQMCYFVRKLNSFGNINVVFVNQTYDLNLYIETL